MNFEAFENNFFAVPSPPLPEKNPQSDIKPSINVSSHQQLPNKNFPSVNNFSIDLDPFSSSSSSSLSSYQFGNQVTDPFEAENELKKLESNPFAVFETFADQLNKMSDEEAPALNFSQVNDFDGSTVYDKDNLEDSTRQKRITLDSVEEIIEEEEASAQITPQQSHMLHNKKLSYDTIQSLDIQNPQLQKEDSDEEDFADSFTAFKRDTPIQSEAGVQLSDAVRDETSTDPVDTFKPVFTKVLRNNDDSDDSDEEETKSGNTSMLNVNFKIQYENNEPDEEAEQVQQSTLTNSDENDPQNPPTINRVKKTIFKKNPHLKLLEIIIVIKTVAVLVVFVAVLGY